MHRLAAALSRFALVAIDGVNDPLIIPEETNDATVLMTSVPFQLVGARRY
jgi:hypothetical protein